MGDRTSSPGLQDRGLGWACFVLTWLALVATGPSGQLFDASVYVDSANRLVDGLEQPAGYGTRGALTQLVYVPAALISKTGLSIERAVLVQNAALLAALGALLLPAFLRRLGATGAWAPVGFCLAVLVVLGRFAPVGFMDIWTLAAVIGALVLVARPTRVHLVCAGALLGVAVNLRPAYLLPSLLLLLAWAVWVRRGWVWVVVGSTTALLAQGVQQLFRPGSFSTWWDGLQTINDVQLTYAAWVVRYDTVPSSLAPQQFFCEPDMAAVQQAPIASPTDLVGHLVTYVPQSIDLVAQKLTAWLMWTWSTPYYDTFDPRISQLSVLVAALVVVGAFGWFQAARRHEVPRPVVVATAALAFGVLGGAVAATPEARFALPLVVLGLVGVPLVRVDRVTLRQAAGLVLVIVVVVLMGQRGLSHPAPAGPVVPETCAAT